MGVSCCNKVSNETKDAEIRIDPETSGMYLI